MQLQAGTGTNPLHVWDGVHSGLSITKTTGMGFTIGPGRAAINAPSLADGTITAVITADEPGVFEPNDTATDRYDLVILRAYPDNPSETGVKVEVIKGVPGIVGFPGSSVTGQTAVPAGAIYLYGVIIGAGMSAANSGWNPAKVTDRRRWIGVTEYTAYTPTFVGFDVLGTNASIQGKYRLDGNTCTVMVSYAGGQGASMGAGNMLAFTLPIPSKGGYVYNGIGSLHHPNAAGLAYDLRILSAGNMGMMWKQNEYGALVHPGSIVGGVRYPWGQGTILFVSLEYEIEEGYLLTQGNSGA